MKSHNNVTSRSCDENSQLDSDVSNNSCSGNIHDSVISTSHAEADHQMPSLTVVAGKDHVGGNNNDQPASLDLTINAPVQPFSSFRMSRAVSLYCCKTLIITLLSTQQQLHLKNWKLHTKNLIEPKTFFYEFL